MRHEKYDLTKGGIFGKIVLIAGPVMGSQLIQMSYNLTDMFWLGRVSAGAVAASGTIGLYMWLSMAPLMFGRMGAEIGVSQNMGRGDMHAARKYGENALVISAALGLAFAAMMLIFRRQLVGFFNLPEQGIIDQATLYMNIVAVGVPFTFVWAVMTACFTASGNSRTPLFVNLIGLGLNMILDPILILGFGLGVAGAAIATIAAQATGCCVMAYMIKKSSQRPFELYRFLPRIEFSAIRRIFAWAAPIAAESAFFTLVTMVASRLVSPFGETALAVGRVGSQIESLSWLLAGGYGSALTSYMGQNFGAGMWGRIRKGFNISMLVMGAWGLLITLFMVFFGGHAFWIFLPDEAVRSLGITYLRIVAVTQIPQCFEAVSAAAFRGSGRTAPPSITSISSNILRVILAYMFVGVWGAPGVWIAITASAFIRGTVTTTLYLVKSRKNPTEDTPREAVADEDMLQEATSDLPPEAAAVET